MTEETQSTVDVANRVADRLSAIAGKGIDAEMDKLETMLSTGMSDREVTEGYKNNTFRANQIKAQIMLLRQLVNILNVKPNPTPEDKVEKQAARNALAEAKKALSKFEKVGEEE